MALQGCRAGSSEGIIGNVGQVSIRPGGAPRLADALARSAVIGECPCPLASPSDHGWETAASHLPSPIHDPRSKIPPHPRPLAFQRDRGEWLRNVKERGINRELRAGAYSGGKRRSQPCWKDWRMLLDGKTGKLTSLPSARMHAGMKPR
jgi:hypothetical protein